MKKLIIATIALLIANTAIMANDAEQSIERQLDKNIQRISKSLETFKAMKAALPENDIDRETTLRKVCDRMKRDATTLNESIACMNVHLEITQISKSGKELDRTRKDIKDLRKQIEELKNGLENDTIKTIKVATR